jgi:hypothetical protein
MEYNLVIISQYKDKKDIYPVEQKILCKTHYNKETITETNTQVNELESSMPDIWCDVCSPTN